MTYSKKEFIAALELQLNSEYNPTQIGAWAHQMYLQHCGKIDQDLEELLVDLFTLEEGPEFYRSEYELRQLIRKLETTIVNPPE